MKTNLEVNRDYENINNDDKIIKYISGIYNSKFHQIHSV